MKNKQLLFILCIVTFLFSIITIGYASVSYTLEVKGLANMTPQEGVFISNATLKEGDGTVNGFTSSIVNSHINLTNDKNSTATIEITFFNNAGAKYMFNAAKYHAGETTYNNEDIVFELSYVNDTNQEVPLTPGPDSYINNGDILVVNLTFKYKDTITTITKTDLLSILQFEFILWENKEVNDDETAANDILYIFEEIVNTGETENNEIDTLFETLVNEMNQYADRDRDDNSYIGNVSGAHKDDVAALDNLFASSFIVNINGEDKEVKIMIKSENIDNNSKTGDESGNEMVIYMTTDTLEQKGNWFSPSSAIVYASVFTNKQDGAGWYKLGDMYEGKCTIKQYDGWPGGGSFDTDTWRSTNSNGQTSNRTLTQIIINLK